MDIMGKLYTNSPVIDFPMDNLGLMYEKLILVGAFAKGVRPCCLEDELESTALLSGGMWSLS